MSRDKRSLLGELLAEVRRSQNATARFDQAVADAAGLNRTDMMCIDVLQREGPMTAGHLAQQVGLSSGAMTVALDRLERSGYARRVRDRDDRRRVLIEPTDAVDALGDFYRAHIAAGRQLSRTYTAAQLELLLGFVRGSRELNEREAAALERRNEAVRGRTSGRSRRA